LVGILGALYLSFFKRIRMKTRVCSGKTKWLLRAVAGSIILAGLLVMWGCGSDSKQSGPQASEKAKPMIDQGKGNPKVVEITPGKGPLTGTTVKETAKSSKAPAALLLDEEVVPPSAPGESGVTRRELEKMKAAQPQIDPMDEVVIPPTAPGEKGLTRRELENLQKQQAVMDPMDQEVVPPSSPGEKGMTLRELERLKASSPATSQESPGPLLPTHPRTQQKK
jgi:hypothetical protein